MLTPATLPEKRHRARVPGPLEAPEDMPYCLLRKAVPTGRGRTSTPRKVGQTPREATKPITSPARPGAQAAPALILLSSCSHLARREQPGCWEGTVRPNYTLLGDRPRPEIKGIKRSGPSPKNQSRCMRTIMVQGRA